jgi:hypothetical protein
VFIQNKRYKERERENMVQEELSKWMLKTGF